MEVGTLAVPHQRDAGPSVNVQWVYGYRKFSRARDQARPLQRSQPKASLLRGGSSPRCGTCYVFRGGGEDWDPWLSCNNRRADWDMLTRSACP